MEYCGLNFSLLQHKTKLLNRPVSRSNQSTVASTDCVLSVGRVVLSCSRPDDTNVSASCDSHSFLS